MINHFLHCWSRFRPKLFVILCLKIAKMIEVKLCIVCKNENLLKFYDFEKTLLLYNTHLYTYKSSFLSTSVFDSQVYIL
jgi:hypothetical protein